MIDRSGHSPAKVFETGQGYFIKCDELGELAREFEMTEIFYQLGFGPEVARYITLDKVHKRLGEMLANKGHMRRMFNRI